MVRFFFFLNEGSEESMFILPSNKIHCNGRYNLINFVILHRHFMCPDKEGFFYELDLSIFEHLMLNLCTCRESWKMCMLRYNL